MRNDVVYPGMQAFLEEGLVEQYMPQPLDVSTLMSFLEAFENEDDDDDDLEAAGSTDAWFTAASSSPAGGNLATSSVGVDEVRSNGEGFRQGGDTTRGGSGPVSVKKKRTRWGKQQKVGPTPPCLDDPAAMFFEVKGLEGALYPEDQRASRDVTAGPTEGVRTAGLWRPGPAAVVPAEFCRSVKGA